MQYKTSTIPAQKRMALIAHDNKKQELFNRARTHQDILSKHILYATGTTGYGLESELGLNVHKFISGPLGGDQQVGAKVAEGEIDVLLFFWDPFEPLPHDPDVKALLRIAAAWNIPVACTPSTADFILHSNLINQDYERSVPDYEGYIAERQQQLSKPSV